MKVTKEASLRLSLLDGVTGNALKIAKSLTDLDRRLNGFVQRRDKALQDLQAAGAQAAALTAVAVFPTVKAAQFEGALESIRQKIDGTAESMRRLNDEIRKSGISTGVGAQAAARTTDALIGLGASEQQSSAMAGPINKASFAYKADSGELAQGLYSSTSAFNIAASDSARALDILATSGKRGAVELSDQARILPSLSAQYAALGETGLPALADLAAQLQIVRKSTGSAEEAGTSLQNFYSSLTGPAASKRLKEAGIDLGKLQAKAAETGQSLVDLVLDAVAKKTKNGADAEKLAELFPDRESQRAIRPLMNNRGELSDIRTDSLGASGTVEKDFESRLATMEGKWQRLLASLEELSISVGDQLLPVAKELVDMLTKAADRVDSFVDANGDLIVGASKAAAALVGFKLATSAVRLAVWSLVIPVAQAVRAIGGIGLAAVKVAGPMIGLQAALKGVALTRFETLAAGLRGLVFAIPGVSSLAGALVGLGAGLAAISAPVWLAIAAGVGAVSAAAFSLWKYWDRVSSVVSGFAGRIWQELKPALDYLAPAFKPIGDAIRVMTDALGSGFDWAKQKLSEFAGWIGSFFQREVLNADQKAAFSKAGYDAADAMIGSIKTAFDNLMNWFSGLAARIINAIGRIDLSSIIQWPTLPGWLGGSDPAPAAQPAAQPAQQTRLGARAKGGPVRAGAPYLVGERGPEIVVPGRSGTVIPNHRLGGGPVSVSAPITIHVTGSSASDLQKLAREAAESVVKAVQAGLDSQLNRSSQTAFSGARPYGD